MPITTGELQACATSLAGELKLQSYTLDHDQMALLTVTKGHAKVYESGNVFSGVGVVIGSLSEGRGDGSWNGGAKAQNVRFIA